VKKSCETLTPRLMAFSRSTSRKSLGVLATKVLLAEEASLLPFASVRPWMSSASLSAAAASSSAESEPSLVR